MICDILIKNAKTRKLDDLVNIAVKDGKIAAIEKGLEAEAKQVIDAAGCLVTESFVNGHLHLDKVYTLKMAGEDALKSYTGGGRGCSRWSGIPARGATSASCSRAAAAVHGADGPQGRSERTWIPTNCLPKRRR